MKGAPTTFWGKLEKDKNEVVLCWHPLADHCADVAACCEALLTRTLLGQRLASLGSQQELSEVQIDRLCFLAALHDLGKYNIGFQNIALVRAPFVCGHVNEVAMLFNGGIAPEESEHLAAILGIYQLAVWGEESDTALRLLFASIGHHGRPAELDGGGRLHRPLVWREARGLDPWVGIKALVQNASSWFPSAFREAGEPLPSASVFQHSFSGLVTLADWLGSDGRFFPFSEEGAKPRIELARERAAQAVRDVGLDTRALRVELGESPPGFEMVCPYPPRPMQRRVLDLPCERRGSLGILESETASGKTEAVLARFLRLFHAGEVDGMYFALPTRTAATEIHKRVVRAIARAFPDEARCPPVVLAVPGYIAVDEARGVPLPHFKVRNRSPPPV